MEYKKYKKLTVQVGRVIIPIFIAMITAIAFAMYYSALNGFLDAQKSHMEYLINNDLAIQHYVDQDELEWYLTRWQEHPEELKKEYPDDFDDEYSDYYFDDSSYTAKWLESIPEELKTYVAKTQYDNFDSYLNYAFDNNTYESLIMMGVSEDKEGMIIYDYSRDKNGKSVGEYYDLHLDDHPQLKKALRSGSGELVCEKTSNFPRNDNYYVGFQPIICNGRTMAVVAVVYNWNNLRQTIITSVTRTILISIAAMLLVLAVVHIVIYRRSIKPVTELQKIVRDYSESKDSEAAAAKTAEINEKNEIGILSDDIAKLAKEMDRYNRENIRLTGEKERVAAELELATKIQAGQLPTDFPESEHFELFASMTPAKEVGGDFYDFFHVDEDHLALVIADVSGKGIPAALFMMKSMMLINNFTMSGLSPKEVMEKANKALCRNNEQHMFVTVWLGILEISTGRIIYSNAGHECPIIRQPDGQFDMRREKHDIVLGGFPKKKYKESEFTLEKGGTLFVYTDGVPEATNADNNMFGLERITEVLNRTPDADPQQLLTSVHGAVDGFVGDAEQFDDLTMLCIKLK